MEILNQDSPEHEAMLDELKGKVYKALEIPPDCFEVKVDLQKKQLEAMVECYKAYIKDELNMHIRLSLVKQ